VCVQAFGPDLAVESFGEPVVGRFARPLEVQRGVVGIGPKIEVARDELAAFVDPDRSRIHDLPTDPFERLHYVLATVGEAWIGCRADTTKENLGVRVPIHRIRDCVATEAIEEMEHGAGWARHLLDHKSAQTTARFYDHSTGATVTRAFGQLLTERRSDPVELTL